MSKIAFYIALAWVVAAIVVMAVIDLLAVLFILGMLITLFSAAYVIAVICEKFGYSSIPVDPSYKDKKGAKNDMEL